VKLVLDAGGTSIRAQIYEHGMCVTTLHAKSREKGLAAYIEEVLATYGAIEVVCISYAGQVREGVILSAPNITVDRHDIKKYFAAKYGIEVLIENDLNCAVLAEAKEHESGDICAVYVGTGLGLGVLSGGNLVRGASSVATELGHIPYKKAPFACGCGRENCIELFASGSALEKWSRYYLLGSCELEALRTSEAAHAKEVYEEFIKALLAALGTVVTLFNPKVLVLGGGVIENNPFLYEIILQNIPLYALGVSLEGLKIVQTTIEDAPLKGAYLLKDTNE
jgi:glucokinase